jgi:hypothetical protein
VLADQGCRNTVFNAKAQTGAEYISSFVASGIQKYRIELVDELPEYVAPLMEWYKKLLESSSNMPPPDFHTTHKVNGSNKLNPTSVSENNLTTNKSSNIKITNTMTVSSAEYSAWKQQHQSLLRDFSHWMSLLPNAYGVTQGHSPGSLKPAAEVDWKGMKATAYQQSN